MNSEEMRIQFSKAAADIEEAFSRNDPSLFLMRVRQRIQILFDLLEPETREQLLEEFGIDVHRLQIYVSVP